MRSQEALFRRAVEAVAVNHAQFRNPNGAVANRNFGLVSSARAPRLIQMGLKVIF